MIELVERINSLSDSKISYIQFLAGVNDASTKQLVDIVHDRVRRKVEKLVLLISTPGGSVFHGISIHNLLKGLPIPVETHNFGSVDSIGVVIYSAGVKRYSVSDARFLLHPVVSSINGQLEAEKLQEILDGLEMDTNNIAATIAHSTKRTKQEMIEAIKNRTTLNPVQAKDFGLVTEIKNDLFPAGADVIAITQ